MTHTQSPGDKQQQRQESHEDCEQHAQQLRADDERFNGTVTGRELLDLVKMLHRICASGVLHLEADFNRASHCARSLSPSP